MSSILTDTLFFNTVFDQNTFNTMFFIQFTYLRDYLNYNLMWSKLLPIPSLSLKNIIDLNENVSITIYGR